LVFEIVPLLAFPSSREFRAKLKTLKRLGLSVLAGVTGVEPAETRFGDECLTVWRHPYILKMAERERFELSGGINPHPLSRRAH
jgi:hypothetical protein